uniref:DUF7745 domain-containing protein n=1 Tax=Nicotiana tabacum TaxID=4097 RepID=A0A1S3ZH04_TOBAC|nr:PREDICTED: uncharacterized protein LOC107786658 [Nicotiana tabacum]
MGIKPNRDLIEALVGFWDPANNVFRFKDCEMTPTLEELGGFTGLGRDLRGKRPAAPRKVGVNNFLKKLCHRIPMVCLNEGWVPSEYFYNRFWDEKGFENFSGTKFVNQLSYDAWRELRIFAFMISFLGIMVFPERGGRIRIRLVAVEDHTILPMILGDIFRALTHCQEGEDYFEGCNILLQMWFIKHLYHHPIVVNFNDDWLNYIGCHPDRAASCNLPEGVRAWRTLFGSLSADKITWNYYWFPSSRVMHMSTYRPFFILMGFRGFQPYAPLSVIRQLGRGQKRPPIEDMRPFMWEFKGEEPPRESYAQKIWFGSRFSDLDEMVADHERGEVSLAYLEWFHNQAIPEQRTERSIRYANDWEREIEVRVRETRREVMQEFQSRIDTLQEDKGILETAIDVQQADFERETAQWAREKQALKAQI